MIPPAPFASACAGKQRFPTPNLAHKVASRKNDKRRSVYHCQYCGGWHLGSGLIRGQSIRLQQEKMHEQATD